MNKVSIAFFTVAERGRERECNATIFFKKEKDILHIHPLSLTAYLIYAGSWGELEPIPTDPGCKYTLDKSPVHRKKYVHVQIQKSSSWMGQLVCKIDWEHSRTERHTASSTDDTVWTDTDVSRGQEKVTGHQCTFIFVLACAHEFIIYFL